MLVNGPGSRRIPGAEVVVMNHLGPLETLASWTRLHATQTAAPGIPGAVPLVPSSSARIGSILRFNDRGRVGLEVEYTGPQSLEDDPYRRSSRGFTELNALSEIQFGHIHLFVNALNLTNVRQTHWELLIRPRPGPGGNPHHRCLGAPGWPHLQCWTASGPAAEHPCAPAPGGPR
jgi:outer membrane receptor for ferrienterochelin and colicins